MKDYKQQNSNKTFGECRSSWNSRTHDECDMMAAEIQAAAICQVCGENGQSAKDYGYQANKGSEKGKKGKKDKKGQRKSPRTMDTHNKKKGGCNNCKVFGHFALNCPRRKKREPHNASHGGEGDLHYCVYHIHEPKLSESCTLENPSNIGEPVTVSVTTMSWTRRFLHKYTEDERMLQSVGVTEISDLSTSVFVWTGGIGILDSWDHREVMIQCDQEQSLKSPAELFREQRRRSRIWWKTHTL